MSSDRELLELAAKAGAIGYDPAKAGDEFGRVYSDQLGLWVWHWKDWWNPLTDDGDALRLAVKLGIFLEFAKDYTASYAGCVAAKQFTEWGGTDPYAATRRAIVRAAAEIGRAMP